MIGIFGALLTAAFGTAAINALIVQNARRYNILDEPTEGRQLHDESMPTAGGLAIAGGAILGGSILAVFDMHPEIVEAPMFWVGAVLVIIAGLWDDLCGLDAKGKFLLQLIAAYSLLHTGSHFEVAGLWDGYVDAYDRALVTIPLSMLWIVGIMNAINLIDGLDGLASGVAGIAFLAAAALFGLEGSISLMYFGIVVAAVLASFLAFNFKPASIFMGDTGSLFLGYLLATYLLQAPLHTDPMIALVIPAVLLGLPVLDTIVAIGRRLRNRRAVFAPDRNHLHHKLSEASSEKEATLTLYAVSGWFGTAAFLMALLSATGGYIIALSTFGVSLVWAWRLGCFEDVRPGEKKPAVPVRAAVSASSSGNGHRTLGPPGEPTEGGAMTG